MQIAAMATLVGLPEEKVAQIAAMVRANGMPDAQMASMMALATKKGVSPEQVGEVMADLGVGRAQVRRVMVQQGLMGAEEAAAEEAAEQEVAAARARDERREKIVGWLKKAGVILFWLIVWEVADHVIDNRLVLAGPIRTLQALAEQVVKSGFWAICAASFVRIAAGFFLSFFCGLALAVASYRWRVLRAFVEPVVSLLRTIPVVSFMIMLLIWVGNQMLTVYLAFLIVLPLIYTNTLTGLESVDRQMLEMARVYGLSKWRTFMYVYRPALMPFLTSSCKISLGMSWKSGIMAEVLATPKPSIGKEMSTARTFLDTPDLFAWTVVVMLLSVAFEKAFLWLLRRMGRPMGWALGKKGE